jgi:RNA polymerase sigma-70 factor (ECF subfamily)
MTAETWVPLLSRIAAGERDAERSLVNHFHRGVRMLVRRHSRPGDPAIDDITQEVLFHIIERLRSGAIKDPLALPAYIRISVVNATTAEYRRRRLRGEGPVPDGIGEIAASLDDPAESLDSERAHARIRALVEELPIRRDREVLVRFYLQEIDKQQICRDLRIDPTHFHRVIHRARERLRGIVSARGLDSADSGTIAPVASPDLQGSSGRRLGTGTHE